MVAGSEGARRDPHRAGGAERSRPDELTGNLRAFFPALIAAWHAGGPINVARAEATREGSALKLFVELRAPGYPGSTYTLTYDPKRDQLRGAYLAVLGQTFDVFFTRTR